MHEGGRICETVNVFSGGSKGGKGCLRVYLVSLRKRNYIHYGPH